MGNRDLWTLGKVKQVSRFSVEETENDRDRVSGNHVFSLLRQTRCKANWPIFIQSVMSEQTVYRCQFQTP